MRTMLRSLLTKLSDNKGNLILLTLSLFIGILFVEGILRYYIKDPENLPRGLFVETPEGFRIVENSELEFENRFVKTKINTGELGLRNTSHAADLGSKIPGVLMMGDSFTFGLWVNDEDTFPAIFEKNANKRKNKLQVFNAGVPAFGTRDQYYWLLKYIDQIPAETIMLFFYINDFKDNFQTVYIENGYPVLEREHGLMHLVARRLTMNLISLKLIRGMLIKSSALRSTFLQDIYLKEDHPRYELFVNRAIEFLERIKKLAQSKEKKLFLVFVPDQMVVQEFEGEEDFYKPIKNWCNKMRIPFYDPIKYFQMNRKRNLYDPQSLHFSIEGNKLMAEYLEKTFIYTSKADSEESVHGLKASSSK